MYHPTVEDLTVDALDNARARAFVSSNEKAIAVDAAILYTVSALRGMYLSGNEVDMAAIGRGIEECQQRNPAPFTADNPPPIKREE